MIGSAAKTPLSMGVSIAGFATMQIVNGLGLEVSPGRRILIDGCVTATGPATPVDAVDSAASPAPLPLVISSPRPYLNNVAALSAPTLTAFTGAPANCSIRFTYAWHS